MADDAEGPGRLLFRPGAAGGAGVADSLEPYDGPLGVGTGRDGVLYVPETATQGAPVLVFFHGAGGNGRRELRAVLADADRHGVVVVAPDSRGPTWDIIYERRLGPDVAFLDEALAAVEARCAVDFDRLVVGGVSDGASYALSVGLTNGDLFPRIIAFSPGFAAPGELVGKPLVFVSHGTRDQILPIDMCGRRVVSLLRTADYEVTYEEFDGGHTVPPPVAAKAFMWWLGEGA